MTLAAERLAGLLAPFAGQLSGAQLGSISTYIDILQRWNAKTNLTAVHDPAEMAVRHFGESLFAARALLAPAAQLAAADVGSGAGFPGLPLKLHAPALRLTLIESQQKKAIFLREVVRALALRDVSVFAGRAEDWGEQADLVTLRAVEKFEDILPVAAGLVRPGGRLALLIGRGQVGVAHRLPEFAWQPPLEIPQSRTRVLLAGKLAGQESRS